MTQIRTQYPGPCWNAMDWQDPKFYPNPPYGTRPNTFDYPTVLQHCAGSLSTMTRNVTFHDGSTYSLPQTYSASGYNEHKFWKQIDDFNTGYYINHGTGLGASFLYGHKGPASAGSNLQDWARGVLGFSWQYKMGTTNSAGIRLKNVILLYRKKEWTGQFAGLWLAKDFAPAAGVEYRIHDWDPFNTRTTKSQTGGSVSLTSLPNQPATNWVQNNCLVFQGIWFEFDKQDTSALQFDNKYFMYNNKLNYDANAVTYVRANDRIVLPVHWRFDSAYDWTKPLKLT